MPRPFPMQTLMRLLKESPFQVRKEAAFALANVCADGGGGTGGWAMGSEGMERRADGDGWQA